MTPFSIDGFADGCKQAMKNAEDKRLAAKVYLERTMRENETADIIACLEAAIPEGADIGEMIVHTSPELTMLYGRVPARFQSGIHNHTLFACIGQLTGEEVSVLYERTEDGTGLSVANKVSVKPGEVMTLRPDAIHHIENPKDETSSALHIYGGDFGAVTGKRSLWSTGDHVEKPFSFKELLAESVKTMKKNENREGLAEIVKAIPTTRAMVEGR